VFFLVNPDNGALLFLKLLSDYLTGSAVVKLLFFSCYSSRDRLTLTTSRVRPEVPQVRAGYAGEGYPH
jgi:hypothetical protein